MSNKYQLDSTDLKKIGTGAMVAFIGLALFYIIMWTCKLSPQSLYNPFIATILMILVNTARKFLIRSEQIIENDTTQEQVSPQPADPTVTTQ